MKNATIERKIGEVYERNRFEVHVLSSNKKDWNIHARNAKTLEQAKSQKAELLKPNDALRDFIYFPTVKPSDVRIIKVTATCEVVA